MIVQYSTVPHTLVHSKHTANTGERGSLLSSHLARQLHPGRVRSEAVFGEAKVKVVRYWENGEGADGGEEWGTGGDTWQSGGVSVCVCVCEGAACAQLPHGR